MIRRTFAQELEQVRHKLKYVLSHIDIPSILYEIFLASLRLCGVTVACAQTHFPKEERVCITTSQSLPNWQIALTGISANYFRVTLVTALSDVYIKHSNDFL